VPEGDALDDNKLNVNGGAIALGHRWDAPAQSSRPRSSRNEAPQEPLRDGDDVRGRRHGAAGIFERI